MSTDSFVDVAMEDLGGVGNEEGKVAKAKDDDPPALTLAVTPRHDAIGIDNHTVKTVQVCATVTASSKLVEDDDGRAPVDITVALDVSGSMSGDKLDLCKSTLELLIRELRPCDRFGLVTFADDARLEIPTRKLTSESKKAALEKVKRLVTRGCTNLSGGISLAIQDLKGVESPNEVRSIFVLTDGLPNRGISNAKGIVDLTKGCLGKCSPPISIGTFGYGRDHNAKLLGAISQITQGGSYYFVEKDADVASAFGDCLGGILSVVAQNATLTISIRPEAEMLGVTVIKVHNDGASLGEDGTYKVNLGDFYAEESRDVLFEVTCASASKNNDPIPHAWCTIGYVDVLQKRIVNQTSPASAAIARHPGTEVSAANPHVVIQWFRIHAANAMKRADVLSRSGQLEQARDAIKECRQEILQENDVVIQSDPLIIQLLGDLDESLKGLANRRTYAASGEMRMQTMMLGHTRQRCYESKAMAVNTYRSTAKQKGSLKFASSCRK
jgi:hypothetical protein